jgi:predicted methyltransferase
MAPRREHAILLLLAACAATPTAPLPHSAANAVLPGAEEEKRREEGRQALLDERARMAEESRSEAARWTPGLHEAAKRLAETRYLTGRAAIEAATNGGHRVPGHASRDAARHPVETLAVFGFEPTMTVLDLDPGEGWYTELLAPALAAQGKLLTTADVGGAPDEARIAHAQRFRAFLDRAPELYGKVEVIAINSMAPSLDLDGAVDLVLLMREPHGMVNRGTLTAWLALIRRALKANGVLGIEDHRAKDGADPIESAKKGYLPERWLIEQVEAAGFVLAAKSEINANPRDTKDYPEGVWTLPPVLALGAKDRARYEAIGESDRMTLKFVRGRDRSAPSPRP